MNKLVITSQNDIVYYGYFQDGKALELYCERKESDAILGNIYVARVDKIAEGIKGAFLDLGDGQKAYYNLSASKRPVKLSRGHEDKLYAGDLILVQITKDAVKSKLPVADSNVSISGKYIVISMEKRGINISKKIKDSSERERLLSIVSQIYKDISNADYGVVIRTNARGVSEDLLRTEFVQLLRQCDSITRKAAIAPGGMLIFREVASYIRLARELPRFELDEILLDDSEIFSSFLDFYESVGDHDLLAKLKLYQEEYPLFLLYRFQHYYDLALGRCIMLKSGASIVIEQTEAMVVIDVNSGAIIKSAKHAQSIYEKTNREAAKEIAAQLRLRNLSGIIIIDFINMKESSSKEELLNYLKKECENDRIPIRIIDFTALNLVEMTRNKVKKPLAEQWKECHIEMHPHGKSR